MNKIITISREFGSGGREIGKRLSDKLGIAYYDREIITKIAQETGMSDKYIENISEKGIYPCALQFAKSFTTYSTIQNTQTDMLVTQQRILKEIAEKGNCIIIGRGANVILKEYNPINLFIYANIGSKIKRCREKRTEYEKFTDKELKNKLAQIDKNREKHHSLISNEVWGDKSNYHLCINTSNIEIKKIVPALSEYIQTWFRRKE